ncbi:uncharacterized protein LOC129776549 [Toxorhynchites rutilus septentrionalis]|uniref:uncharacterized protein LOC129776549 n=1 Tax=Toxorhynchites rutilus septentrionalis TaxID=329112 RepID=UPI0024783774|nr:uncharacterized protein LOC129776549 [Toxorhynchites rutilus septentrionalis]
MRSVLAVRVVLLISLISLVCGNHAESSKSSNNNHSHKHRPKRYEEDNQTEQVYYVDQIASDSEISPWTSNRIIAKTTENGKPSQYIINVSPDDEVIIHDRGANDRSSAQEPDHDQSPQDYVKQALRLREQYLKGSKNPTALPASSFVEYTTVKYDHKPPPSAPPVHYSKPVSSRPTPPPPPPPPPHVYQVPAFHRPKHIKSKPSTPPVRAVTQFSDIELPEAEATSPYRKENMKAPPKSPKQTSIKQQDTAASSMYIQKVKPMDSVITSYNTHHDTGNSFKEFQHLPLVDSDGSESILNVDRVKPLTETFAKRQPVSNYDDSIDYFENKHNKHISSEEIRFKPKLIKPTENYPKTDQFPNYPEKIRHTMERNPMHHFKEHTESPKAGIKFEQDSQPSAEPYRYIPPKSYPPEEAQKFKFLKEISTTVEPYKPHQQIKTYVDERSKPRELFQKEDHRSYNPQPKKHHPEYFSDRPKHSQTFTEEQSYKKEPHRHMPFDFKHPEFHKSTRDKQMEEHSEGHYDYLKVGSSPLSKHFEDPSPTTGYSKVTAYPTQETSSTHQTYHHVKVSENDPYKFKPSPTPEISVLSHGFHKPSTHFSPKYIPTKMPQFQEPELGLKKMYPSQDPMSNYIPSSTQESYRVSSEYPKVFSMAPTTYSPKYAISSTPETFDFPHMSEVPKSFSKYGDPTTSSKVYGTIVPSEQPFKTLSTKIYMKPSSTEHSYSDFKDPTLKSAQNRTTGDEFKPSPIEEPKTEYYTNPELTTYYVFANGTEIKLGNDPSKIPPEFRVTSGDTSFFSSNYSTKLAEDLAMKYNWDTIPSSTRDGEFYVSSETAMREASDHITREKKKGKPLQHSKPLKPIKTITVYRNTHRSADDSELEGGFEPSEHFAKLEKDPRISDKRGEVADDDEDFFFANGEVILQDDPNKASKKNAIFLPTINRPGQVMLKITKQQQPQQLSQDQQVPDMDMSAEPSKKQYFVLYHIEDNKKKPKPPTTTQAPTQPPIKQEIHYHYSENETEDPEVTHEHYNYHHEETIEESDDDIQHHYVNPNAGKFNFRPNIAHSSYKYKDSSGSDSETTIRVIDPNGKNSQPLEITKQDYMRHVQNAVIKYMKQLQDEGKLTSAIQRDSDETQKTFEEVDIAALLNGHNAKHKFQLSAPMKVALPVNPSNYKPVKTVPSSSTYKPIVNLKIPKNTYPAGKPLKSAIESLQEQLGNSVDLTVKTPKATVKPDLSAIDVGQSYLHGPSYEPAQPLKTAASSFENPSVVQIPSQKAKLHFNQQTYHDINSLTNVKETQSMKPSSPYSSIKGGTASVGASISFGGSGARGSPTEEDHKLGPEALDAPIQIINGIPVTNPYNIDINTLRYMLGGLAQAQAEQQQHNTKPQETTLKLKGANWMSLPTVTSPAQIFSSNMPTFHHSPSEANNYKYNSNFDSSNFKIKLPKNMKDFKMKPVGADTIGSSSMNYASWGEPIRQNRPVGSQQQQHHQHQQPQQLQHVQQQQQQYQHQLQQVRPNREFNAELFLNPHGTQFASPIMRKKNGPVDRKSIPNKPVPSNKVKSSSLDTNLRPPPR